MRYVVFYRDQNNEYFNLELKSARDFFYCINSRLDILKDDFVIGRYNVLPFFKELENDINKIGANLINSYEQHKYVADIKNWYYDLKDITPKTWFNYMDIPKNESGPFVLKGNTNSKKFLWDTHMFSPNREKIMEVYCRLQDDALVGDQSICIRKFEKLINYGIGIHNLPITKEFRFFVAYKEVLCGGFYWSNFADYIIEKFGSLPSIEEVPKDFLNNIINIIDNKINFYVIDIAQTIDNNWIVIELNDGQMSGLSENDSALLYKNLSKVLKEREK